MHTAKRVIGDLLKIESAFREVANSVLLRRFYYADQRFPDGRPVGLHIDGDAHADLYWTLAHESGQSRWLVTFVKDEGRRDFVGVDFDGNTRQSYDEKFGR